MDKITLYPSNWLYNAGVVGFLRVLISEISCNDKCEYNKIKYIKNNKNENYGFKNK